MRGMIVVIVLLTGTYLLAQTKPAGNAQGAPPKAAMDRGKKVYDTHCLSCHQAGGAGITDLYPPLTNTTWVSGDKKKLITIVLNGMSGEIVVNGKEYDNEMPSQAYLKDGDIADVLTYIRNSFGNKASVVTPAEVKALRGKTTAK